MVIFVERFIFGWW